MANHEEVTLYYYEMFLGTQFGMVEGKLLDHGFSQKPLSQGAPFVTYLPHGKRKPRKLTGDRGNSYIVVLRGTGYPDPPAPFTVRGGRDAGKVNGIALASGGSDCKRIYAFDEHTQSAFDPRYRAVFDSFINRFSDRIIADYREPPLRPAEEGSPRVSDEPSYEDHPEAIDEPAPQESHPQGSFDPSALEDGRRRNLAERLLRPGQAKFRQAVLDAYDCRCAITGCNILEALEAAHIIPYCGPSSDHVTNALLLRLDLHSLFDAGLLGVHPESLVIELGENLRGGYYSIIEGHSLRLPRDSAHRPNRDALAERYADFLSRNER